MDGGEETITDADELARVRRQAGRVWAKSFIFAAVLTAALLFLPT